MGEWLRGVIFQSVIYAAMGIMGIAGAPVVLWRQDWAHGWARLYCRFVFLMARLICGLRVEIRGAVPSGGVLVAAKHQSMLDVFMLYDALPKASFVMKRELVWVPIFGLYALRVGTTPVSRGKRGAGDKMLNRFEAQSKAEKRQIVIYPQGTRVSPGAKVRFKSGAVRAYQRFGLPMVLAATNTGMFWPRRGWAIRAGTAVVEFGETVPPGLPANEVAKRMETGIERESIILEDEAVERYNLPEIARAEAEGWVEPDSQSQ